MSDAKTMTQPRRRPRVSWTVTLMWSIGVLLGLLWIFPLYWMVVTSLKPEAQILSSISLIPNPVTFEHYVTVFRKALMLRWFTNSLIVATSVTVGRLALGSLTGYALARMHFPGRHLIFWVLLASLMIPDELTVVPLFIGVLKLKLDDTYWALILPALSGAFAVFLYRQFFLSFPSELEDAAAIDGCNKFQTFWHIVLPLAKAVTLAGAILIFTDNWNDYLWPLLVSFHEEWMTLPVGAATFNTLNFQQTNSQFGFGPAMAAMAVVAFPTLLFFLVMQRYFIQGITRTGLKG
jgi:multiple sugar transport system permease protein